MTVVTLHQRICSVEGCLKPRLAKGYCPMHYARLRKHGEAGSWECRKRYNTGDLKSWLDGDIAYIDVGHGLFTKVDAADYEWLSQWIWHVRASNGKTYVRRSWHDGRRNHHVYMHRAILKVRAGMQTDHVNGDTLDNRRSNLRACNTAQNAWNSKKRNGTSSRFKGVSRVVRRPGYWQVHITANGEVETIGTFADEVEAAMAYNARARELFGDFACLNEIPARKKPRR